MNTQPHETAGSSSPSHGPTTEENELPPALGAQAQANSAAATAGDAVKAPTTIDAAVVAAAIADTNAASSGHEMEPSTITPPPAADSIPSQFQTPFPSQPNKDTGATKTKTPTSTPTSTSTSTPTSTATSTPAPFGKSTAKDDLAKKKAAKAMPTTKKPMKKKQQVKKDTAKDVRNGKFRFRQVRDKDAPTAPTVGAVAVSPNAQRRASAATHGFKGRRSTLRASKARPSAKTSSAGRARPTLSSFRAKHAEDCRTTSTIANEMSEDLRESQMRDSSSFVGNANDCYHDNDDNLLSLTHNEEDPNAPSDDSVEGVRFGSSTAFEAAVASPSRKSRSKRGSFRDRPSRASANQVPRIGDADAAWASSTSLRPSMVEASLVPVSTSNVVLSDVERQAIVDEAEEQTRKKMEQNAVRATLDDDDMHNKSKVGGAGVAATHKRRRLLLLLCIFCTMLVGAVVGIVIGVTGGGDNDSSSDASSPSNKDAGGQPTPSSPLPGDGTEPSIEPAPAQVGQLPTGMPTLAPGLTIPPAITPAPVQAQDPCTSNNRCECAKDIGQSDLNTVIWGSTVDGILDDSIETCNGISRNGHGAWYRVQPHNFQTTETTDVLGSTGSPRRILASLCKSVDILADDNTTEIVETDFDTQISVFAGDQCDRLSCISANDQGGDVCSDRSRVTFAMDGSMPYYVYVHGFRSSRGTFLLEMSEVPNSFTCDTAIDITYTTAIGSTEGAPIVPPEVGSCGNALSSAPGVWFKAISPGYSTNRKSDYFNVVPITEGFVPQISGFKGDSCDSLTCVSGDVNSINFVPEIGNVYYVLVHGAANTVGDFYIEFKGTSKSSPPIDSGICVFAPKLEVGSSRKSSIKDLTDEVDPIASCGGDVLIDTDEHSDYSYSGTWFRVNGAGGILRASTCNDKTRGDTRITVLSGDCFFLECLDANDDISTFSDLVNFDDGSVLDSCSVVEWFAHEGARYHLIVHAPEDRRPSVINEFTITLEEVDELTSPMCELAQPIPTDGTSIIGVTSNSTAVPEDSESIEASCLKLMEETMDLPVEDSGESTRHVFWYSVVGTGETLTASTCHPGSTDVGAATTTVSVMTSATGTCDDLRCMTEDSMVAVPCGDHMSVSWQTVVDEQYFVMVKLDAKLDEFSTFALTVESPATNSRCETAMGPVALDGESITVTTRSSTRSHMTTDADSNTTDYPRCGIQTTPPTPQDEFNGRDVWFTVVGNGFDLIASTCSIYTQYETRLDVYVGGDDDGDGDDDCGLLTCIEDAIQGSCDDIVVTEELGFGDAPQPRGGHVRWKSEKDVVYHVRVSGRNLNDDYGIVNFRVGPANDVCSRASPLQLSSTTPGDSIGTALSVKGTTMGAKLYAASDFEGIFEHSPGVWYKIEGITGVLAASTCNTSVQLPTRISIYEMVNFPGETATFGKGCSGLTPLLILDQDFCGLHHSASWFALDFQTFYILVQGVGADFDLDISVESL